MTLRTVWIISIFINVIIAAKLLNCPETAINFQKILGLRPQNSANIPQLLLYRGEHSGDPITVQCIDKCWNNTDCQSFVLFYNTSTCYWLKTVPNDPKNEVIDPDVAWFVKVCLESSSCGDEKLWTSERIPGATFIGHDTKRLPNPVTRTECQQSCLDEDKFECKSANFKISNYRYNGDVTGTCVLSDSDRHSVPSCYRASTYDEEYLENECTAVADYVKGEFCGYEEFANSTLAHVDLSFADQDKDSCQKLCDDNELFNCRGYSLVLPENHSSSQKELDCLLHSEDSKVHGPRLVVHNPVGKYYERAPCINISITCTETYMTVTYTPNTGFNGKMYMQGYSEQPQCYAAGETNHQLTLRLSLLSNQCGLLKARSTDNRTLMAGILIIQYNPLVQTQGDRVIRVGCIQGNDSKTLIGTGITITTDNSNIGIPLFNLSASTSGTPVVEMKVVDFNTKEEVSSVEVGQELQLTIEIKPGNGPYDIWAGHLVAMTENSADSILLLDDRGCPTNINIFPPLTKVVTNDTRKLVANFQAFKFADSPVVRFSVIVQFCPGTCPEINCGTNQSFATTSRRKRDAPSFSGKVSARAVDATDGTTVLNVNRTQFENSSPTSRRMLPLEFIIVVRNPSAYSDKLILGDSKILVAGYNYATNEVCLDYSLFIGLIVTWILIQIIFVVTCFFLVRRYKKYYENEYTRQSLEELHKNFGIGFSNLENRRVRWADNEDFT